MRGFESARRGCFANAYLPLACFVIWVGIPEPGAEADSGVGAGQGGPEMIAFCPGFGTLPVAVSCPI